jgi:gamma-glutamyl-gamma-aminobutyrate hydrolase PuuD
MTPRTPPVVGISASHAEASWGAWSVPAVVLAWAYVEKVRSAGGLPVVLAPGTNPSIVERLDALVLSGGTDVGPERYGAARHLLTQASDHERDESEIGLLRAALEISLPTLGICRGLQLVNVALGGTLHQHLPDSLANDAHLPSPGVFATNAVHVEPGSELARVLGGTAVVACHHHQGVDALGHGLAAVAWTDDGAVEAIEADGLPLLAVQWHPEEGEDSALFEWLVRRCAS